MVRAQLTSTITMSSRDRSETITSGFAAGLAWPPRVARRAADPAVVMDAPRPCLSTVLRFATRAVARRLPRLPRWVRALVLDYRRRSDCDAEGNAGQFARPLETCAEPPAWSHSWSELGSTGVAVNPSKA